MLIYSMKPGHDGSVAAIDTETRELLFSYEAEKDSFPRYEVFNPSLMIDTAYKLGVMPNVFAISGWSKAGLADNARIGAGYFGIGENSILSKEIQLFGQRARLFSSSHAASHIWSSYGMSPFPQGQPCYVLIWEGALGDFYEIDKDLNVHHRGNVMMTPGMASLLLQASAFLSVIAGYVFFGESISHIKKLGILFAFVGFCILVLLHDQSIPKLSLFLMFIAAIFWTICNTIIKIKKPDNVISFIAWSSLFVPIPVILISLIYHYVYFDEVSWVNLIQIPDLKGWSSILFQFFITTLLGYGIWTMLINKNGLSSVAPYSLLVPIFGLFFGWLIYHEQLALNEILGSLLVIIGLVFLSINFVTPPKKETVA